MGRGRGTQYGPHCLGLSVMTTLANRREDAKKNFTRLEGASSKNWENCEQYWKYERNVWEVTGFGLLQAEHLGLFWNMQK